VLTGGAVLLEGMSEFAEEILGMPVRIGYPVGIRGITQLVQGPQFATGVGLVKFGAHALSEAHEAGIAAAERKPVQRTTSQIQPDVEVEANKGKFWQWFKAAF